MGDERAGRLVTIPGAMLSEKPYQGHAAIQRASWCAVLRLEREQTVILSL